MLLPLLSLLLIAVSFLGWQSIHSSVLAYQSAVTSSISSQQFLIAEYVLHQAENWLKLTPISLLPMAVTECQKIPCILVAKESDYYPKKSTDWWKSSGDFAITTLQMDIPQTHQAYYIIEQLPDIITSKRFYRITVWALLLNQSVPTVIQSTWQKSLAPTENSNYRQAWRRWI